jgi:hypothetical protein
MVKRRGEDFLHNDPEAIYERCVETCLDSPSVASLLNKRPNAGYFNVLGQMQRNRDIVLSHESTFPQQRARLEGEIREQGRAFERFLDAVDRCRWPWWQTCLIFTVSIFALMIYSGLLRTLAVLLLVGLSLFALARFRGVDWGIELCKCLATALRLTAIAGRYVLAGLEAVSWGRSLEEAIEPTVLGVTRTLLGEDPDSLLLPGDVSGLMSPRETQYLIDSEPQKLLRGKIGQITAGAILVCGPRGAGKSTLLERSVARAGFGVMAQAPATYAPHDFVTSLSVQLCEKYIEECGYDAPSFSRLSSFRRVLRRARRWLIRFLKWALFALPAGALLVFGLADSVRASIEYYSPGFRDDLDETAEWLRAVVQDTWNGTAVGTAAMMLLVSAVWWWLRKAQWIRPLAQYLWYLASTLGSLTLLYAVTTTTLEDEEILRRAAEIPQGFLVNFSIYSILLLVLWRHRENGFLLGGRRIGSDNSYSFLVFVLLSLMIGLIVMSPTASALLAVPGNPLRIAALIAAVLLFRARDWEPRPSEPSLVAECRSHLYRLQTIQMSTATLSTGGASQFLNFGANHSASLSTIPPNYPELVAEFREILTRIAAEYAVRRERVVIAIDEVDRLGSEAQARDFLSEIKAIFGVPHVHYLVSVAEEVGAAFVRRGLPHRDVTDSSFDDIFHVQPATLEESTQLLGKRANRLGRPYVMLAHALSGGIPRDLIRYARRMAHVGDKTELEMIVISRRLILEELAETLAGFRTLLSKLPWTQDNGSILGSFRGISGLLRKPCSCGVLDYALEDFAFHPPTSTDSLSDDARQLIDEASAYAYFSLTLLSIFGTDGLGRRTEEASDNRPYGAPETLGEARQELAVSPYSARPLITEIRKAWGLHNQPRPSGTSALITTSDPCPVHGH